jgi:anti-anti-sigma factor
LEAALMLVVQEEADVLKVHFSAHKILTEVGIEDVGRELLDLTEHSHEKILLDFEGVELMSSSMFGKLIALNKKCKSADIDLRICNLSRDMTEVVKIAHLDRYLKIHPSTHEALDAFGK